MPHGFPASATPHCVSAVFWQICRPFLTWPQLYRNSDGLPCSSPRGGQQKKQVPGSLDAKNEEANAGEENPKLKGGGGKNKTEQKKKDEEEKEVKQ